MNRDYSEDVLKQLKKEVTRSQKGGEQDMFAETSKDPSCQKSNSVSGAALHKWLSGLNPDAKDRRKRCNREQKVAIKLVVDTTCL